MRRSKTSPQCGETPRWYHNRRSAANLAAESPDIDVWLRSPAMGRHRKAPHRTRNLELWYILFPFGRATFGGTSTSTTDFPEEDSSLLKELIP